jgi:hypothetical protein
MSRYRRGRQTGLPILPLGYTLLYGPIGWCRPGLAAGRAAGEIGYRDCRLFVRGGRRLAAPAAFGGAVLGRLFGQPCFQVADAPGRAARQ